MLIERLQRLVVEKNRDRLITARIVGNSNVPALTFTLSQEPLDHPPISTHPRCSPPDTLYLEVRLDDTLLCRIFELDVLRPRHGTEPSKEQVWRQPSLVCVMYNGLGRPFTQGPLSSLSVSRRELQEIIDQAWLMRLTPPKPVS